MSERGIDRRGREEVTEEVSPLLFSPRPVEAQIPNDPKVDCSLHSPEDVGQFRVGVTYLSSLQGQSLAGGSVWSPIIVIVDPFPISLMVLSWWRDHVCILLEGGVDISPI